MKRHPVNYLLFQLLSLTLLLAVLPCGAKNKPPERHVGEVKGGYNFWLSASEDTREEKPLIIFLHGASLCGSNLDRVKRYGPLDALARGREIDAYILAPQNPGGAWRPESVKRLLDWAKSSCRVDTTRIYVVGMSLGGFGTLDFAARYPEEIAAAVGICGGATASDLSGLSRLPLWIIHGIPDRAIPISQSDRVAKAIAEADSGAPRLIYERVPGLNHGRPARLFYLPEFYDWLFAHNLSEPERPVHPAVKVDDTLLNRAYIGLTSNGVSKSKSARKKSKSVQKNSKKSSKKRSKTKSLKKK